MQNTILFEAHGLVIEEMKQLQTIKEQKIIIEEIPHTKPQMYKAVNTTDDVMNFFRLGTEVAAVLLCKSATEKFY